MGRSNLLISGPRGPRVAQRGSGSCFRIRCCMRHRWMTAVQHWDEPNLG